MKADVAQWQKLASEAMQVPNHALSGDGSYGTVFYAVGCGPGMGWEGGWVDGLYIRQWRTVLRSVDCG